MNRGFSTLEILIAMAILVSSFTAVVLLTSAESLSLDSRIASEALSSARKALETQQAIARQDFRLVVATTTSSGILGIAATTTVLVDQYDPITREFMPYTKKVTATVSWNGTFGRTQKISLSGLVTNFNEATGGDSCSTVLTDANGNHANWKSPSISNSVVATLVGDANANAPYPITDVDAYQKRLYVSASTSSTPLLKDAGAGADSAAVGSNPAWSNPGNIISNNSAYASRTLSGTSVTHYLKATNFGLSIPPGATVLGIKAEIDRSRSNGSQGEARDSEVKIVRSNDTVGSQNKAATGTNWPTVDGTATYPASGTTDMWGENWSACVATSQTCANGAYNVNHQNFGLVLAVTGSSGSTNRVAQVDDIRITVYYTKQFYIFNISNPASPVFLGGLATSTLTSGINALAVATSSTAHYVYAATNSVSGTNQLQVINVTNPATPFVVSTGATGMTAQGIANGIFYKDGYVYLTLTHIGSGPEFNIVDVSTPGQPQWKGGYTFGTTTNSVYVKDGYAYVSTNDANKELLILNVTNPASPSLVGTYNATPDQTNFGYGRGLYTVGNNVYFGRSWTNSSSIPQFLTLDASTTPVSLVNSKSLGTNYSLRDIIVRDYLAFLLLGSNTSGGQLQIISATSTAQWATPVSLPSGATGQGGVAMDCEGNYVYVVSMDSVNKGYISSITGN